jgi:putative oxygen-independent coproporphyrinogen III oxidase
MALIAPPLALYLHFPWCIRKCPYCDFNSYTLRAPLPEDAYVRALIEDLSHQAPSGAGRPLVSVFLGGGTPSLFSPEAIERVLAAARAMFGFDGDIEVTLEANPGAIEHGRFREYRAAGVNRVSLGAQSFDHERLRSLGRIHSPAQTRRAAEELHEAGLPNFNLDLMYALPGQDVRGAIADVEQAIALEPAHVSHYQLTIEAGTVFAASPPRLPPDETVADMLEECEQRLAMAGFERYETSAYARTGRFARHNCNYWSFGDYLGVGAGAHGKLSDPALGRIVRTVQARKPRRYLAARAGATSRAIEPRDLPFEFMLNALRLAAGFDCELFESRTGLSWGTVGPALERLERRGLARRTASHWQTTPLGARFLNELLLEFLPDPPLTGGAKPAFAGRPSASMDLADPLIHRPRSGYR